jgi:tetratricopeptide (TPR) repeat protein
VLNLNGHYSGAALFLKAIVILLLGLLASCTGAFAQNANDIMNIFGGIMQSAIAQATLVEWKKLPQIELSCVDQTLRQRGSNLQAAIQQGITPSDARIANIRSACRSSTVQNNSSDTSIYYVANTTPPDGYLSLRTNPSTSDGQRITTMPNGTLLRVLQRQDDGWWHVKIVPAGPEGWAISRIGNKTFIACCTTVAAVQAPAQSSPVAENQSAQTEQLLWDLNGSRLYLVAQGKSRKFIYKQPRPAILNAGAKPESLLFEGETIGDQYQGTAYFHLDGRCGQFPIRVSGPILDNYRRVELHGRAPRIDSNCRIIGYVESTLALQLIEPNVVTSSDAPTAAASPFQPTTSPELKSADVTAKRGNEEATKNKISETEASQDAPLTDCDKYAASDFDQQRKGTGIAAIKVNPNLAIPACEDAVQNYPNTNRFLFQLGRSYVRNKDYAKALDYYRKASDRGYVAAWAALGSLYSNGFGVPKNDIEAVTWFRKAAEEGSAFGQAMLGIMYDNGRGVAKDDAQAVAWYRKAADQGNSVGQAGLGGMYALGRGVAKDDAHAVTWYRKAADQGNDVGQTRLGFMYQNGLGVAKNDEQAIAWYRKAADQGNAFATNILKGFEYAKTSDTSWRLTRKKDEMTDKIDVRVSSLQKNEKGVVAEVEGSCEKSDIVFSALVVDDNGKPTIQFPDREPLAMGNLKGFGVQTRYRINDDIPYDARVPELDYSNKFALAILSKPTNGVEQTQYGDARLNLFMNLMSAMPKTLMVAGGSNIYPTFGSTWRIMVELKTSMGPIVVKIPMFDDNVQEMVQACK